MLFFVRYTPGGIRSSSRRISGWGRESVPKVLPSCNAEGNMLTCMSGSVMEYTHPPCHQSKAPHIFRIAKHTKHFRRADDYSQNDGAAQNSPFKAVLVNRVVVGNGLRLKKGNQTMTRPPPGFHSVCFLESLHCPLTTSVGCRGAWRRVELL
jgi:hypothetical protein